MEMVYWINSFLYLNKDIKYIDIYKIECEKNSL